MFGIIRTLKKPVVYHTLFWGVFFLCNTVRWGSYFGDYRYSFRSNLVEFPIHILLTYLNLYSLIPRLIPRRFGVYFGLLFVAVLAGSLLRIVCTYQWVTTDIWRESGRPEQSLFDPNYIAAVFIGEVYVLALTAAVKLTIDWVKAQQRTRELERRTHETELSFLKSQLQPHFFFNTLNNLYALTLDKSDQAPEMILKLSELMSYVIYQTKDTRIRLMQEIRYMQHYIDLEQLRHGDTLQVVLELEGNLEDKQIPPLLLLPFIENSFKHGKVTGAGQIYIRLAASQTHLFFRIENSKEEYTYRGIHPPQSGGIGIQNARRRLELLYPNAFVLDIQEDKSLFRVELHLPVTQLYSNPTLHEHSLPDC